MSDPPGEPSPPATGDALPPGFLVQVGFIFYLVMAIAAVVWIGWRVGAIPLSLFVTAEWPLDLALGASAGATLVAASLLAERTWPAARQLKDVLRARLGRLAPGEALSLAFLSGFAEELFFRGAVQGALGPFWATVLFAALHWGGERALRLWSLFALLAGAVLAALVAWRGDLFAAVVAHVAVNGFGLWRLGRGQWGVPSAGEAGGDSTPPTPRGPDTGW